MDFENSKKLLIIICGARTSPESTFWTLNGSSVGDQCQAALKLTQFPSPCAYIKDIYNFIRYH